MKDLKVTNIRYYETRRGLGYECKTNIKGLFIWNDGNGGMTYLDCDFKYMDRKQVYKYEEIYSADDLEKIIDKYEGITQEDREKVENQLTIKL